VSYSFQRVLELVAVNPKWVSYWSPVSAFIGMNNLGKWKFHPSASRYFPTATCIVYQKGSPLKETFGKM